MFDRLKSILKPLWKKRCRQALILTLCLWLILIVIGMVVSSTLHDRGAPDGKALSTSPRGSYVDSIFRSKNLSEPEFRSGGMVSAGLSFTIIIYGDVNMDGHITASDAYLLLRYIAGLEEFLPHEYVAGDVEGNGGLDIRDTILILRHTLALIDKFPVQQE